jgi:membrane protein DedA with SNARE-associated domain
MEPFLEQYGYMALLVGTFFEGETAILVASSLIHDGLFNGPLTVFFGFAGSFISDWLYYFIGRLNGKYFIVWHHHGLHTKTYGNPKSVPAKTNLKGHVKTCAFK